MDLGGGDTDIKPLCRSEEGAQLEGEVLDLPVTVLGLPPLVISFGS